ncbi:unnamed protein product [Linum tenue]|uniref:Uncharacterized protein n=1 Tax=Linum tenue TaxID=586396 RepID=A0AAV0J9E0_9ROSI|nr:unnamed protein product [Linum tenue]
MQGKVAVITGGATGLGASAARLFARHGAKVVIADIQPEPGRLLSETAAAAASYVHCDVTVDADVRNAVDAAVSTHGRLDVMLSNAGVIARPDTMAIASTDPDDFRRVFDVNVYGAFLAAKHAARVMMTTGGGAIVFMASNVTESYGTTPHAYVASKHAVVGLMKNLCVELGGNGIRVNSVSPFGVPTAMALGFTGMDETAFKEETYEGLFTAMANLKGVVFKAEDVAEAALTLVSDESRYISGVNLLVDGGHSLKSA